MLAEVAACIGALLADALAAAHDAGDHPSRHQAGERADRAGRPAAARRLRRRAARDRGLARHEDRRAARHARVHEPGAGERRHRDREERSVLARRDAVSARDRLAAVQRQPGEGDRRRSRAAQLVPPVRKRARGRAGSVARDRAADGDRAERAAGERRDVAAELRAIARGGRARRSDRRARRVLRRSRRVRARARRRRSSRAIVASAKRAIAEGKLPRAIALADRASALAPGDPAVTALIETRHRGRPRAARRKAARDRRRWGSRSPAAAALGVALAAAGGATARRAGARRCAASRSAPRRSRCATSPPGCDAAPPDATPMRRMPSMRGASRTRADAGTRRERTRRCARARRSTRCRRRAARCRAATAIDAARAPRTRHDRRQERHLVRRHDRRRADGRGRRAKPSRVDAGRHAVALRAAGHRERWTKQVEVARRRDGHRRCARCSRRDLDVAARGRRAPSMASPTARAIAIQLKRGRRPGRVGRGAKSFLTIVGPCQLRPDLECYPGLRGFPESVTSAVAIAAPARHRASRDPRTCGWQAGCSTADAREPPSSSLLCCARVSGLLLHRPDQPAPVARHPADAPTDAVYRGDHREARAVANDPEVTTSPSSGARIACTDATDARTAIKPPFSDGLRRTTFDVHRSERARVRRRARCPSSRCASCSRAKDELGATARPDQELLIPVVNRPPTLELARQPLRLRRRDADRDVYAKVGDADDGPAEVDAARVGSVRARRTNHRHARSTSRARIRTTRRTSVRQALHAARAPATGTIRSDRDRSARHARPTQST